MFSAAQDAEECVKLAPKWAKGYSRLGLARFSLRDYGGAIKAYAEGLTIEPTNEQFFAALEEARAEPPRRRFFVLREREETHRARAGRR